MKQAWDEHEVKTGFDQYLLKKKKDEELAKATGILNKKARQSALDGTTMTTKVMSTEDTVSEDCNTNNNPMSGSKRSTVVTPKGPLTDEEIK